MQSRRIPRTQLLLDLSPRPPPPPLLAPEAVVPALADLLLSALGRGPAAEEAGDEQQDHR